MATMDSQRWTEYVIIDTRGQGQIGLLSCTRCGGVVMLDQEGKNVETHDEWHDGLSN